MHPHLFLHTSVHTYIRTSLLTGYIPPELNSLKLLSRLDLSHNTLSSTLPSFKSLSLLKTLDLSYNQLNGVLDPSILPPSIISLSLSHNLISGPLNIAGAVIQLMYISIYIIILYIKVTENNFLSLSILSHFCHSLYIILTY